ncbi:uncharacterized protein GGS25DRAFT_517279 [Hypoxylon fragiforme]|uniref:uncharacterized protein n=1 Tax=Hypoxylon fragiforme TaxID=63214 RepID=UPI0020C5B72B|nr:uncharacterized protein GGS25DRAFT_517279 [Hypoxylon fragiforme]KAI2614431.1 hypothetical protein GGS25DRAFT_517279 [Hypoxylon fragiforme]
MHRASLAAVALAALASTAPITSTEPTRTTLARRQFSITDPGTWLPGIGIGAPTPPPPPTFTLLPPVTGGLEPSDKKAKRQDHVILPPITGGLEPSDKKARRQDTIGIGDGTTTDPVQAHIKALELQYEALVHEFGTADPPRPVARRIAEIEGELLEKYGIRIVQSPDGTTTTFVPGKKRRRDEQPGYSLPGGPLFPLPGFPGGGMNPDPVVPGGPIEVSD